MYIFQRTTLGVCTLYKSLMRWHYRALYAKNAHSFTCLQSYEAVSVRLSNQLDANYAFHALNVHIYLRERMHSLYVERSTQRCNLCIFVLAIIHV